MKVDRTEQHNLAGEQPERSAALAKWWSNLAERCGVAPNGLPKNPNRKQGGGKNGKGKF